MSNKNKKKIGFWAALAMLVSSVVGIGIFFKNNSIANGVDRNGMAWLTSWIVGGILSLSMAINFAEIGSFKSDLGGGVSLYAEKSGGKWFGYFNRINYGFFNLGISIACFGYFVSETFFDFVFSFSDLKVSVIPVWGHALVGIAISFMFFVLNYWSLKWSSRFQMITLIKFLPLFMAIIVGIIFWKEHNLDHTIKNFPPINSNKEIPADMSPLLNSFNNSNFDWIKIIVVLPAILFSYDSFATVGSLTSEIKGEEKTISKVVFIGMIFVAILYLAIAIASIFHNQGDITGIILDSLPKEASKIVNPIMAFTLFLSCLGATNALTAAYVYEIDFAVKTKAFFGSVKLTNKLGQKRAGMLYGIVLFLLVWTIIAIPSFILNTNQIFDGVSNFTSLFYFAIYGMIIFLYLIKRKTINTKKINNILFWICAVISIIGITIVEILVGYTWIKDLLNNEASSWGFIAEYDFKVSAPMVFGISIVSLIAFIAMPYINYGLVKLIEKRDPLTY